MICRLCLCGRQSVWLVCSWVGNFRYPPQGLRLMLYCGILLLSGCQMPCADISACELSSQRQIHRPRVVTSITDVAVVLVDLAEAVRPMTLSGLQAQWLNKIQYESGAAVPPCRGRVGTSGNPRNTILWCGVQPIINLASQGSEGAELLGIPLNCLIKRALLLSLLLQPVSPHLSFSS